MPFIARNPLMAPEVESPAHVPHAGTRGLFAGNDGWYDIDSNNKKRRVAFTEDIPSSQAQADWTQTDETAADYIKNKPSTLVAEITDGVLTLTQNNFTYKTFIDNNTLIIQ